MQTCVYVPPFAVAPVGAVDKARREACELGDLGLGMCFEDWRALYGKHLVASVAGPGRR